MTLEFETMAEIPFFFSSRDIIVRVWAFLTIDFWEIISVDRRAESVGHSLTPTHDFREAILAIVPRHLSIVSEPMKIKVR